MKKTEVKQEKPEIVLRMNQYVGLILRKVLTTSLEKGLSYSFAQIACLVINALDEELKKFPIPEAKKDAWNPRGV